MSQNSYSQTPSLSPPIIHFLPKQTYGEFEQEDTISVTSQAADHERASKATPHIPPTNKMERSEVLLHRLLELKHWSLQGLCILLIPLVKEKPAPVQDFGKLESPAQALHEQTTSATLLLEKQLQQIEQSYVFRDELEVKQVIRENSLLPQLLLDAHCHIETYFPDSQVFLEVATDYDAPYQDTPTSSNKEILISIATAFPPRKAMDTLRTFHDKWWINLSKDAKRKISVGLEFI